MTALFMSAGLANLGRRCWCCRHCGSCAALVALPASAGQLRAFLNAPGEPVFLRFEVKNEGQQRKTLFRWILIHSVPAI
jgi:hypothetical protein